MPAPLIISPSCTMLIIIPTKYPSCSNYKGGKHKFGSLPYPTSHPLFASVSEDRLTLRGQLANNSTTNSPKFNLVYSLYILNIFSPNPWQGAGPDPEKDLG